MRVLKMSCSGSLHLPGMRSIASISKSNRPYDVPTWPNMSLNINPVTLFATRVRNRLCQRSRKRPDLQSRDQEFTSGGTVAPQSPSRCGTSPWIFLKTLKRWKPFFPRPHPRMVPPACISMRKRTNGSTIGVEKVCLIFGNPTRSAPDGSTLSQMWVVRGSDSNKETIEGGWQKYRDLYGDWRSRLFIYFTPDNYGSGGCYNLTCGAFVQVNNSVYIGGGFTNYSSHGGPQHTFKLLYKDGEIWSVVATVWRHLGRLLSSLPF